MLVMTISEKAEMLSLFLHIFLVLPKKETDSLVFSMLLYYSRTQYNIIWSVFKGHIYYGEKHKKIERN